MTTTMIISNRPNQLQSFYSVRTSAGHVRWGNAVSALVRMDGGRTTQHNRDASTFGIQATLGCGLGPNCTLVWPRTCQALWRHVYAHTLTQCLPVVGHRRNTERVNHRNCFERMLPTLGPLRAHVLVARRSVPSFGPGWNENRMERDETG